MSLSFTICPDNPAVLYFVVAFKTQINMEDQKDGEDQLEHCSGSSSGITQHNSGVKVKRNW